MATDNDTPPISHLLVDSPQQAAIVAATNRGESVFAVWARDGLLYHGTCVNTVRGIRWITPPHSCERDRKCCDEAVASFRLQDKLYEL